MPSHILVIEDEVQIARILKLELEYEGYQVTVENDGRSGLETALVNRFDLILLDILLPKLSGIEVLRRLRKVQNFPPVILVSARNSTFDKVAGLDLGANDYITKPYEIEELLARIRACIRDYPNKLDNKKTILTVDDLVINTDTREVKRKGQLITLTPKEYDFLIYLVSPKYKK